MKCNKHDCDCDICKYGKTFVESREARNMQEEGWYAHIVVDGDCTPHGFNWHTHGFEVTFGQPDIQICFPMPPEVAHAIGHSVVDRLREGLALEVGKMYDGILKDEYKVQFIEAWECQRRVLRLVLPDKKGGYSGKFADQFTMLNNIETLN